MRLITPYAPDTFLKPCIIVSTIAVDDCKETAVAFADALNVNHSMGMFFEPTGYKQLGWERKCSEWIIIKKYSTKKDAVKNHMKLTKNFHNGGTGGEWSKGYDDYLKLYEKYCPKNLKEK